MRKDKTIHADKHSLGYIKTNNRKMTKARQKSVERVQSVPVYERNKYNQKVLKDYRYINHDSIAATQSNELQ